MEENSFSMADHIWREKGTHESFWNEVQIFDSWWVRKLQEAQWCFLESQAGFQHDMLPFLFCSVGKKLVIISMYVKSSILTLVAENGIFLAHVAGNELSWLKFTSHLYFYHSLVWKKNQERILFSLEVVFLKKAVE